jgi:hypothetical protein
MAESEKNPVSKGEKSIFSSIHHNLISPSLQREPTGQSTEVPTSEVMQRGDFGKRRALSL